MRNLERAYDLDKPLGSNDAGYLRKEVIHARRLARSSNTPTHRQRGDQSPTKPRSSLELGAIPPHPPRPPASPWAAPAIRRNTWVDLSLAQPAAMTALRAHFVLGRFSFSPRDFTLGGSNASGVHAHRPRAPEADDRLRLGGEWPAPRGGRWKCQQDTSHRPARTKGAPRTA